jgi:hypothetical protein
MPITFTAARPNYAPPQPAPDPAASLLDEIEHFLAQHPHITEGKFGCLACNSYYIITAIRKNCRLLPKTERSIREFMRRRGQLQ